MVASRCPPRFPAQAGLHHARLDNTDARLIPRMLLCRESARSDRRPIDRVRDRDTRRPLINHTDAVSSRIGRGPAPGGFGVRSRIGRTAHQVGRQRNKGNTADLDGGRDSCVSYRTGLVRRGLPARGAGRLGPRRYAGWSGDSRQGPRA